jgi:hypothetical protein
MTTTETVSDRASVDLANVEGPVPMEYVIGQR